MFVPDKSEFIFFVSLFSNKNIDLGGKGRN